jgi:DNA repair protein RadA/Sms
LCTAWSVCCPNCRRSLGLSLADPENDGDVIAPLDGDAEALTRFPTGIKPVDALLHGGPTAGSVTLLYGEQGCGKSTLALQLVTNVEHGLFFSAERRRADVQRDVQRLHLRVRVSHLLIDSQNLGVLVRNAWRADTQAIVIDSAQTAYHPSVDGLPGDLAQRLFCFELARELAEQLACAVVVVSQVTKKGSPRVPNTVQHDVDAVLEMRKTTETTRTLIVRKSRYCSEGRVTLRIDARGLSPEHGLRRVK